MPDGAKYRTIYLRLWKINILLHSELRSENLVVAIENPLQKA